MHKDLLKEKTNLFNYNKLIKNKDENAINNYITKNKQDSGNKIGRYYFMAQTARQYCGLCCTIKN